ncbi:ubiquitin carboxyl-terminal hydrolase 37 isoform X2 [Hypomesus transpacificus]|uniref:ubiquitin carboxyl-terminal hydrolase 37 isoform X2 n=1 Tax=Hypomesus transpacificus TaxID=137520 RepID=UPI001F087397|nr:ubiquitin carboxyl-terminal hydrolase 37 isoform X2 [Hypomesus transpacificus]
MAATMLKLSSSGAVRIRFNSIDLGTTRWKEGTFEIIEKDNKVNLCIRFISGGAPKTFQLNHNIKNVVHTPSRLMVTLKDSSVVTLDSIPLALAQKVKEYLEKLKQGKSTVLKASHGSACFSILGNRSVKNESSPSGERQSTPRRQSLDREETTPRKPLGSPSRVISTPARSGLSENRSEKRKRILNPESDLVEDYPKENDSFSNNKATSDPSWKFLQSCKDKLKQAEENRSSVTLLPAPLQATLFYGSRSVTKDYSQTHSFLDRPPSTTPAKRSLMMPNHSTPFKKMRSTTDYGGWNRPRPSTLAQSQPPLQGFSNLGNTCYMNAILQSLFSLPSFSNDLLKQGIPWKKVPANALLRRFAHLLAKKDVSCPEMKKDLLRRVKSAISSTAERFSGYMQNDAHEFLSQCLDQLKEDVEKVNKSSKSEPAAVAAVWEEPQQFAARSRDETDSSRIYTCPVIVNMEFEVQHTITCKGCGEVVTKREQFNDLSIDLPRRKKTLPLRSIQDSLDLFFRMEEIEYSCEKCSGKTATVTHKFSRLPRKGCVKAGSSTSVLVDSDGEEEPSRKVAIRKRRFCDCMLDDERTDEIHRSPNESADLNEINDDEMLAAVFEMSRHEDGPSGQALDDEPTSSPDTGFGDNDVQELAYHTELLDTENKQSADVLDTLDLTMDENKENQTPVGVQGELDWVQQYSMDQEREEQELQQALAQSLQEHEAQEMREDDDLKRATELSLQDFNNSLPELLCSDEDSGNEDVLDMEYTETEAEGLRRNAESGDLANSFRLISVVSHIGSSSSSGHYISDVYDMRKQSWLTFNDLDVSRTQESNVQRDRDRSGYIFFYMHKDVFEELSDLEKTGGTSSEAGRSVLQPL